MKAMNLLKRTLCCVLSLVIMLGTVGLPAFAEASHEEVMSAYRKVAQSMLNKMDLSGYYERENKNTEGIATVFPMDLLGDSTEEMVIAWVEDTPNDEWQQNLTFAIYTYRNGMVIPLTRKSVGLSGAMNVSANRFEDKLIISYSPTKTMTEGLFWDGSRFVEKSIFDGLTEEENEYIGKMAQEQGRMGQSAAHWEILRKRCGISKEDAGHYLFGIGDGGAIQTTINGNYYSTEQMVEKFGLGIARISAQKALSKIQYYGDRKKCRMPENMALGYAEVLENIMGMDEHLWQAVLVDIADDGMPILVAVRTAMHQRDPSIWGETNTIVYVNAIWMWDGEKVQELVLDPQDVAYDSGYNFGYYNGIPAMLTEDMTNSVGIPTGHAVFKVENGMMTEILKTKEVPNPNNYDEMTLYINGEQVSIKDYVAAGAELNDRNWQAKYTILALGTGAGEALGVWTDGIDVVRALRQFVAGKSAYPSFVKVTESEDDYVYAVAQTVASEVGGEIKEIYKLTDGIYYVLIVVDGGEKGAVVRAVKIDGKITWKVEKDNSPRAERDLIKLVSGLVSKPNISPDYNKIQNVKNVSDVKQYLTELLDNLDGVGPNEAAKTEIGKILEIYFVNKYKGEVGDWYNHMKVNGETLRKMAEEVEKERRELEEFLMEKNAVLMKPITIIIQIIWKNCDANKPFTITLDKDLVGILGDNTLRLVLSSDARAFIQLPGASVEALVGTYESLNINISKRENTYIIEFFDANGNKIESLPCELTFAFPADSLISTVFTSNPAKTGNWGGQYDSSLRSILFNTQFAGEYEIMENDVQIDDIGGLPEESAEAIRFMVSKEYMDLDGNNFLPEGNLTRYEFTKALVGMFFAYNEELTTSFTDVEKENEYYPYVAAAELEKIVKGFDEVTFGGERDMTVEQMLTLAARTLVEHKEYQLPDDATAYISVFEDYGEISAWAEKSVALCVREQIVDAQEFLHPQNPITREQAAVILYRLFLLLYEVTPVETVTASGVNIGLVAGVGGGAVAAGGAGVGIWYFLKRRRKLMF
ncbi:MAG: S-layer homology domain-containing protein [Clostridia bacterium]|nr:S-layer homology domain-containing protein [Clostridia bacterium]